MYSEDYNDPFGDSSEYSRPPGLRHSKGLATASLVLAVISLLCGAVIYVAVPCGALAILFALLSRGDKKMPGKCKVSLILGAVGAVSSIIMTVGAFYMLLTNREMRNEFRQLFNYYAYELGLDYDFDDLENMLGIDSSDDPSDDADDPDDYYNDFWEEFYSRNPGSYDTAPVPDLPDSHNSDSIRDLPDNDGTVPIPDDPSIFSGGEFI